ncbi:hypothetical protein [Clostridium ganghwense]|uniref:ABC transporter permease n=1 Tax=Clostridium ganghwense TaxID=312089 RepID=A0ABT4CLZ8_9CLOT|nr:hypothetical protein [Clostridium ganghwense]MCY6370069.1 hypothetical protein [Clostridium ganghwense]
MINLIKAEIKKSGLKIPVIGLWLFILYFSTILIRKFEMTETYADLFSKFYGIAPLCGLLMFIIYSGAYTKEYDSGMVSLINTTKQGKKQIVKAKWIAHGIMTSITNLSIFGAIFISAASKFHFKGLDLPLKQLWYFGKSSSNMTILQLAIITSITIILGSFLFAQIGLALSANSKSAAVPFIVGAVIMGIPYIIQGFIPRGITKFLGFTPLWGMFYGQIIRYKTPFTANIFLIVMFIAVMIILPKITYKAFTNENRK